MNNIKSNICGNKRMPKCDLKWWQQYWKQTELTFTDILAIYSEQRMHSVLLLLADSNLQIFFNSHLLISVNSDLLFMDYNQQYTEKKQNSNKVLCNKTELFLYKTSD